MVIYWKGSWRQRTNYEVTNSIFVNYGEDKKTNDNYNFPARNLEKAIE